ncbi:MAG: hypothetical protein VKK42_27905 [Lyngbya sp.]|nr:hypothetical protein [Lyngbya sp.]
MKINQSSLSLRSNLFSENRQNKNKIEEIFSPVYSKIFQKILNFLVGSSEPKIWQYQTKSGDVIWHIYDPRTGKTEQFISDQDVRVWIENQYYS